MLSDQIKLFKKLLWYYLHIPYFKLTKQLHIEFMGVYLCWVNKKNLIWKEDTHQIQDNGRDLWNRDEAKLYLNWFFLSNNVDWNKQGNMLISCSWVVGMVLVLFSVHFWNEFKFKRRINTMWRIVFHSEWHGQISVWSSLAPVQKSSYPECRLRQGKPQILEILGVIREAPAWGLPRWSSDLKFTWNAQAMHRFRGPVPQSN